MITENELNISNKSYINKDFPVIYTELLETAKKLSSSYNPETSNETDPFIVLLKLLAFIGDKLNYNADSKILEAFMPSATQESSMRSLCEMVGYDMKYYIAPETEIFVTYVGDAEFTASHTSFTLPRLTTVVSTQEGDVQYVLTANCSILGKNVEQLTGTPVIQGQLKTLTVFDSEKILLENLDSNNRLYFPEITVAQNGVFVTGGSVASTSDWKLVTNLNLTETGSAVYKFGFDSFRGFPYIEFPKDIASLIGDGLTVQYIVTNGPNGNVKANSLTTLKSPLKFKWDGTEDEISLETAEGEKSPLVITNVNAAINGAEPEKINSAYNNYKKMIGTFNTLVSTRDYANAIYNLMDSMNLYPLVSNIQVADRRTDINYGSNVIAFDAEGVTTKNISSGINAYDLCLYPLKSMKSTSISAFKESFKPNDGVSSITRELEYDKCLSHNYKTLASSDLYAIKNYYLLKAKISTTIKVSNVEAINILSNINSALVSKYNARNVDFGYEIPFDDLLETIETADERIKSVSLYEPELSTYFMQANGNEYKITETNGANYFMTLVAKNILSGKVSLFEYDSMFNFDYGQKQTQGKIDSGAIGAISFIRDKIESVTTHANIDIFNTTSATIPSNPTVLKKNEVIQIVTPSLITDATYPYGINYYLALVGGATQINKDSEYELKSNEKCIFEWTDSNKNVRYQTYEHGDILKPNFNFKTTAKRKADSDTPTKTVTIDGQEYELYTLTTNDKVEHRKVNKETTTRSFYCYWILNNSTNTLTFDGNGEYMLEDGEYFFQTSPSFSNLYTYGAGTVIKKTGYNLVEWTAPMLSLDDIDEKGLLGHKEYFVYREVDASNYLTFIEQTIITLVKDNRIYTYNHTLSTLTNSFVDITSYATAVHYSFDNGENYDSLSALTYTGGYWKIRERLDIDCGPDSPQVLDGKQSMVFNYKVDSVSHTLTIAKTLTISPIVEFSKLHQVGGGNNVDLRTVNIDNTSNILLETAFCYEEDNTNKAKNRNDSGYDVVSTLSKTYNIPVITNETLIMMIYNNNTTSGDKTLTASVSSGGVIGLAKNYGSTLSSTSLSLVPGINCVIINNATSVTISVPSGNSFSGTVIVSKPKLIKGINPQLGLSVSQEASIISKVTSIDTTDLFYYNNDIENSKIIESEDLSSPYAFYDYNNIANKWTISEIDFDNIDITIARSSLK